MLEALVDAGLFESSALGQNLWVVWQEPGRIDEVPVAEKCRGQQGPQTRSAPPGRSAPYELRFALPARMSG